MNWWLFLSRQSIQETDLHTPLEQTVRKMGSLEKFAQPQLHKKPAQSNKQLPLDTQAQSSWRLPKTISRLIQASFYIYAGVNHFLNPRFFLAIVPPWVPNPELANEVSGAAEIILGIMLLIPRTMRAAAWGIIALLIAVFPANWYQYRSGGAGMNAPSWVFLARLPLQLVLIAWAYWYTKD